jgi:hypothetical protein
MYLVGKMLEGQRKYIGSTASKASEIIRSLRADNTILVEALNHINRVGTIEDAWMAVKKALTKTGNW